MKTSLMIDDHLVRAAKSEAMKRHTSVSAVLTHWARIGREVEVKGRSKKASAFRGLHLGGPAKVDVNRRVHWMEMLET